MSKNSSSLKELKGLREAVLAEEKAKTQARLQSLPPSQHEQARQESILPEPPSNWEPPPDASEIVDTNPAAQPSPAKVHVPQPPPRVASSPAPAAPSRAKPVQEPALIIPLTPKIQERLQKHVDNSRWSQADLVIELIRAFLH